MDIKRIGERLRQLRLEKGETQLDIAKLLGNEVYQIVTYYEAGKRIPNVKHLITLAIHFETSIDYLLGLSKLRTSYIGYDLTVPKDENNDIKSYIVFINDNLDTYGCEKYVTTNNAADAIFEAIDLFKNDRGNENVPVIKAECFERVAMLDVKKGR